MPARKPLRLDLQLQCQEISGYTIGGKSFIINVLYLLIYPEIV